jgi:peptide/nickel transport system permease protein
VYPGALLIIISLCINFIGDGLRDAVDPKMQAGS